MFEKNEGLTLADLCGTGSKGVALAKEVERVVTAETEEAQVFNFVDQHGRQVSSTGPGEYLAQRNAAIAARA